MPTDTETELTPEQLDDFIAQASQSMPPAANVPQAPPNTNSVSAPPRLLPPVPAPSPPVRNNTVTVTNPPTSNADIMAQIQASINEQRFKTAQDAYDASVKFQSWRAYQRAREAGVPEAEALRTWGPGIFGKSIAAWPKAVQAATPVPPPSITNINGIDILSSGARGERATPIPQSARPVSPLDTEGTLLKHPTTGAEIGVRFATGPRSGQILGKPATTELQKAESSVYRTQMNEAAKEITAETLAKKPNTNTIAKAVQIMNTASNALLRLSPQAAPAPSSTTNEVIRVTKDGKRAVFDANTKAFIRYAD